MKSKPTLLLIAILAVVIILVIFVLPLGKQGTSLISPSFKKIVTESPTPIPSPTPRQFQFDQSTDLNEELDSINPQVLDSDFE